MGLQARGGSYDNVIYCTVCGEELSRTKQTIEKLPHTEEIIPGKAASCTESGLTDGVKCSVCGEVLIQQTVIPAAGHTKGEVVVENEVAADCVNNGSYDEVIYCIECGEELSRETIVVGALGHTEGAVVVENMVGASCSAEGSYDNVIYCTVCGEELSRTKQTIEKLPHTEETIPGKAASCTESGLTDGVKCSVCGEILDAQEIIPAAGHTKGEVVVENEVAADCVNNGSHDEVIYCTECGEELSRETIVVDALGHTEGAVVVENMVGASCSAEGSYDNVIYCTVCGEELSRTKQTIDKLPHTEEIIPGKAASCTESGLTDGVKCSVCGEILVAQTVIPAAGHSEGAAVVENEVAADCVNNGSYDEVIYCTVCGEELNRVKHSIPAKGHIGGDAVYENTVPASCGKDGSYDSVVCCSVCGEELSRTDVIIPATGNHTEGSAVKENEIDATCTDEGSYDSVTYCSVCGEELSRIAVIIPVKEHADADNDGSCDNCGEGMSPDEPVVTPKPDEPVVTPTPDEPVVTPTPDEPVVTPTPDEPVVTPKPDEPVVTPKPDEPVVTPKPDEPVVTPKPDEPVVTPKPDEPVVTPTPDEPVVTPMPDEPVVTPTPDVPVVTPKPDEPVVTPTPDEPVEHIHKWSFSAEGGVISAACVGEGDCDAVSESVSLRAPADAVYSGSVYTVTVEGSLSGGELTEVSYSAEPVNAGTYTATVGVVGTDVTASVTFVIVPKALTAEDVRIGSELIWNGSEQTRDIIVGNDVTVTVDGNTATNVGVYELTVSGTGNYSGEFAVTYTVQPDVSLLEGITAENVSSDAAEAVEQVLDMMRNADTALADEATKQAWQQIVDEAESLQQVIEETAADVNEAGEAIGALNTESVTSANKAEIEKAVETIEQLLAGKNLTDVERTELTEALTKAEQLLDAVEDASSAIETETITKVEHVTVENVTVEDKDALEAAKAELEQVLTDKEDNYTEAELEEIQAELDRMEAAIASVERVETVTETINRLPENVTFGNAEDERAVTEAMTEYNSLTDHEKSLVADTVAEKLETLAESMNLCMGEETCPSAVYVDVDTVQWYHFGVDYAVANGYMVGVDSTHFAPDSVLTRAMVVQILYNMAGSPAVSGSDSFTDTADDAWYTKAILWAAQNGIVAGYSAERFGPNDPITREQMVAMFYRYCDSQAFVYGNVIGNYADADNVSEYAVPAMSWAVQVGLIAGVSEDRLAPKAYATRAQMATVLMRFVQNIYNK